MDKAAIKTFAINSRRKLMEDVEYRMSLVGVTRDGIQDSITDAEGIQTFNIGGATHSIYDEDIKKRENLIKEVNNKGFENVVEEVAYTWFNRIIAIRYMEVNDYLPTRTRVLSSETPGKTEPDFITEAFNLDLDYTDEDKQHIFKLKDENKLDELFRFLFIKQCNKLNEILPGLFEKTEDYMELLLNISFVSIDSVVRNLIDTIPEKDFTEQVEIIGWLYQFYNTELKDDTFANLKKKIKISKERIPAATQLFTPDWIVKYMVENSLGQLWLEGHPNDALKENWEYFVEKSEQDTEVELKLNEIKNNSAHINLEDIKIIDPCMGSGHILVYVFDVLMQIYVSEGYTEKDATISILENNLYGLDIDDRAYQLAYFAIMMKARSYNRRIFNKNITPLICSIQESNNISNEFTQYLSFKVPSIKNVLLEIVDLFKDAKEYGCILNVNKYDFEKVFEEVNMLFNNSPDLYSLKFKTEIDLLKKLVLQAQFLSQQYDVVVTNPPYMGSSGMNKKLKEHIKKHYPMTKGDLFAVFLEKGLNMIKDCGFNCMVTMQSWMFLSSFEEFRKKLIEETTITNLLHMDNMVMRIAFGTSATVFRNFSLKNYNTNFFHIKLSDVDEEIVYPSFFNEKNIFRFECYNFNKIPGTPIAYWVDNELLNVFQKSEKLINKADPRQGMSTSDNKRFLRQWYEINFNKIGFNCDNAKDSDKKWYPYNKGGSYRKWWGNQELVINYENDGFEVKNNARKLYKTPSKTIKSMDKYFHQCISWSSVSSGNIAFRFIPKGFIFDVAGSSVFINNENEFNYIFGFLNSVVAQKILDLISPTVNYSVGYIKLMPLIFNKDYGKIISNLVNENILLSKEDWDDYELSWNFTKHPFLKYNSTLLKNSFEFWADYKNNQFNQLKSNEIRINEIFLKIYNLNYESDIENKYISINHPNIIKDIKSFISYAVGCMLGRYSLDEEGMQFAGGEFDINKYSKFIPDDDNIIPVLDTEYFNDDIVGRFVEFVKTCFGEETLEENLDFIAGALKKKGNTSREIIRNYFLTDFFKDHVQTYKKCPIYWQFDSGKQNGFKCLIYMHRYDPSLVARVRTDYLHKTQKAIEQNIIRCDNILNNTSSASEKSKVTKEKNKLVKQLAETREYDEALAYIANQNIEIDLDDGVKVNYAKFQNVEVSKEGQKAKKVRLLKKY